MTEHPLIGQVVNVAWTREDNPGEDQGFWHAYKIIAIHAALRMILLEGHSDDMARFTGPPIWVPLEQIHYLEVQP